MTQEDYQREQILRAIVDDKHVDQFRRLKALYTIYHKIPDQGFLNDLEHFINGYKSPKAIRK